MWKNPKKTNDSFMNYLYSKPPSINNKRTTEINKTKT